MMTYDVWIGKLKGYLSAKKSGNESSKDALLLYDAVVETSNDIHQKIVDKYKKVLEKELEKELEHDPEFKGKRI